MQGYGLFTLEEMVYSPTGIVFSRGPGNIDRNEIRIQLQV